MRRALVGVGVIFALALTGCSKAIPVDSSDPAPSAPIELDVKTVHLPDGTTAYCVLSYSGDVDCIEGTNG